MKIFSILALFILLTSCGTSQVKTENDYKSVVEGLQIQTFNVSNKSENLIVLLHGDSCNADYMKNLSKTIANKTDALTVLMARPGCSVNGRTSNGWHGENGNGKDNYTEENIDMVEKAVSSLKKHYKVKRTYLIGHSGGAATSGIIIGHNPDLVDGAVLVAFPSDIQSWREHRRGHNSWTSSLSPQDFISSIKSTTRVYIISGEDDSITIPALSEKYTSIAKEQEVNIEHIVVPNEDHRSIIRSQKVIDVVRKLVKD